MKQSKIIGLTGTIGSGKTSAANILKEKYGLPVIDADQISADILKKGAKGLEAIKESFGNEYVLDNGEYNRELMSKTVFEDPAELQRLNALLHPIIKEVVEEQLKELEDEDLIVYDCPLLFESGEDGRVDDILVITVDQDEREKRIKQRDGLATSEINSRISSQISEDYKISQANTVIYNNDDLEMLEYMLGDYLKTLQNENQDLLSDELDEVGENY